ncbi:MAG: hypothetical protein ACK5P7_02890 [Bdellovibrio sp.]
MPQNKTLRFMLVRVFHAGLKVSALTLLMVGCASRPLSSSIENVSRGVEIFKIDLFGTTSMRVPSGPAFDEVPEQKKRVVVECQFQSFVGRAEVDRRARHETYSDYGHRECLKWAGQSLQAKGVVLLSAPTKTSERWVFRFEDSRENKQGSLLENFYRAPLQRMWGTLTRFEPGATKPAAHVFLTGESHFFAGKVPPSANSSVTQDNFLQVMIKSLIARVALNPNEGAELIED